MGFSSSWESSDELSYSYSYVYSVELGLTGSGGYTMIYLLKSWLRPWVQAWAPVLWTESHRHPSHPKWGSIWIQQVFWVLALGVSSEKNPRPFWAAKDARKTLEAAQRSQFRSRNQVNEVPWAKSTRFSCRVHGSTGYWFPWSSQMSFSPISPASSSSEQTRKLIGCIHDIWAKVWCPQQNHHYIYRMGPPR